MKSLYDISWQTDEKTYGEDRALSQSILGRFDKEGFSKIANIYDKIDTPSLVFGRTVDTLLTSNREDFNNNFIVSDKILDDEAAFTVKTIYDNFKNNYQNFIQIPIVQVSQTAKQCGFWPADKWSDAARYNGLLKKGNIEKYYQLLKQSENKTVIDIETYNDAIKCVATLKTAEATRYYFAENTDTIKRFYQIKFKAILEGVEYKGMLDNCLVDYINKKIYPIDLKTSSTPEYEFYKSFIKWDYQLQARLYYRLLKNAVENDEYFKDFEIEDFTFVVVNRYTLTPLTWRFSDTKKTGTLEYGNTKKIIMKDPYELGTELHYYLTHENCKVPNGINTNKTNSLVEYLEKM